MGDQIISAGIDIGTSTSHLSISRIGLENVSAACSVPRICISERTVLYESPVYDTPLNPDKSIDAVSVARLIAREYEAAQVKVEEIQTGALIVTGESAKLRNARELSMSIAALAGDFVVASAGPHLESLLAGRGAGAESASVLSGKTICNIDIGGGTCNYAVFFGGEMIDSACLGIGGRFMRFSDGGALESLTESGETFLDAVDKLRLLTFASVPDSDLLELLSSLISEIILQVAASALPPQIALRLMQTEPLTHAYKIDEYWFSGGVAECMRSNHEPLAFRDMGKFLADALILALAERGWKYKIADSGIRATVIGAGSHTLQLSGCTVYVSESLLPLRNLRIIRPFEAEDYSLNELEIAEKLSCSLARAEIGEEDSPVALFVCDLSRLSYSGLQQWARAIAAVHEKRKPQPLVILSREDIGLALGQTIRRLLPGVDMLILDGVDCRFGDYVDIGRPLANRLAVPLTVKTLLFK